ncbi:hypothetical protein [Streptomyces sp. NPDC002676]
MSTSDAQRMITTVAGTLILAYGVTPAEAVQIPAGTVTFNCAVTDRSGRRYFAKVYRDRTAVARKRAAVELAAFARSGGVPVSNPAHLTLPHRSTATWPDPEPRNPMPSTLPTGTPNRTPTYPEPAHPARRLDVNEMLSALTDLGHMRSYMDWVPRRQTLRIACGTRFDAVRVPADIAARALDLLGPGTGPVLATNYTQIWHFLLRPGLIQPGRWETPGTRVLRRGTLIAVPPCDITAGDDVRWVVPPGTGITRVLALKNALAGRAPAAPPRAKRHAADHTC